jgi:hypothetical protein
MRAPGIVSSCESSLRVIPGGDILERLNHSRTVNKALLQYNFPPVLTLDQK